MIRQDIMIKIVKLRITKVRAVHLGLDLKRLFRQNANLLISCSLLRARGSVFQVFASLNLKEPRYLVNRDVISPHVWIARRTNRDQLYLGIQARSWSFRRGVRFEIESQMRTEHCQEEKEKLGAKIQVFKNTFHFKARTEESVMILLV